PSFRELEFLEGGPFVQGDRRVAILGENVAGSLKKHVGDPIEIQQEDFRVIGVFKSFSNAENGSIVVPLMELQQLMVRPNRVSGFSIVLDRSHKDAANVDAICTALNNMTDERGRSLGLSAKPTPEFVKGANHIVIANAMAWIITAIALV